MGPTHYRFFDTVGPDGVTVRCQKFDVVGETPCCYYVLPQGHGFTRPESIKKHRRRVLKDSWRRYCYPDLEQALRSYRSRKKWQIQHAKIALCRAEAGLAAAEWQLKDPELIAPNLPFKCESGDEYIKGLGWGEY